MNKLSEMFKKLGFTFSFKRLKKAIILVTVFVIIGIQTRYQILYLLQEKKKEVAKMYLTQL